MRRFDAYDWVAVLCVVMVVCVVFGLLVEKFYPAVPPSDKGSAVEHRGASNVASLLESK